MKNKINKILWSLDFIIYMLFTYIYIAQTDWNINWQRKEVNYIRYTYMVNRNIVIYITILQVPCFQKSVLWVC